MLIKGFALYALKSGTNIQLVPQILKNSSYVKKRFQYFTILQAAFVDLPPTSLCLSLSLSLFPSLFSVTLDEQNSTTKSTRNLQRHFMY